MRKVAIVQARIGSSRLPGKVLIKIKGKTVLEHLLTRLTYSNRVDEIILATTDRPEDKEIIRTAKKLSLGYFAGSEKDVLSRFIGAAQQFKADLITRISADCPLIDPFVVDDIVSLHLEMNGDYTSNVLRRTFPRGIAAEVFPIELLKQLDLITRDSYHREHVTSYVREHPSRFKVNSYEIQPGLYDPDWRWVLDTRDDLHFIRTVYEHLYQDGNIFISNDVLELIRTHPELMKLCQVQKPKGDRLEG